MPALIEALGSWDNKTFNKAATTLRRIGMPAVPAVRAAIGHEQLYVRLHARELIGLMPLPVDRDALIAEVAVGLRARNAMDRVSTAKLLGRLLAKEQTGALRAMLGEYDPDCVRAAAFALAELRDRDSVPQIVAAMERSTFPEMKVDLAVALARLGSAAGVDGLLDRLDYDDELIREKVFEAFVQITGQHLGYEYGDRRDRRLAAIGRLRDWWSRESAGFTPKAWPQPDPNDDREAFHLVGRLGGGAGLIPAAEDDEATIDRIVAFGQDALPALVRGLKYPPGYAAKRASILAAMQRLGDRRAGAFALPILRDPVFGVAHWAASALEQIGDEHCLPALRRFEARVRQAAQMRQLPESIPSPDPLLATSARTRLLLGDDDARVDLVSLLTSADARARETAILALEAKFGERRGYDPKAAPAERLQAAGRWAE